MRPLRRRRSRWTTSAALVLALQTVGCAYTGPEPTCPPEGTDLDWEGFAGPFYDRYCTRCHAAVLDGWYRQGAPGYWDFDDYADATVDGTHEGDLGRVWDVVAVRAEMPPSSVVRPSQAELHDLGEWLACGQPE